LPSSKLGISSSNRHHNLLNSILPKKVPSLLFSNTPEKSILKNANVQDQSYPRVELQTVQLPQGMTLKLANLEITPARKTDDNNNNKNSRKTFNQLGYIEKKCNEAERN
jgi:hypothetical protein